MIRNLKCYRHKLYKKFSHATKVIIAWLKKICGSLSFLTINKYMYIFMMLRRLCYIDRCKHDREEQCKITGVCWKQAWNSILNILYIVWLNLIIYNFLYADTKQLCMSQLSSKKSRTTTVTLPTTTTNLWINIWSSGSYFIRKDRFANQTLWRINYLYNIFMNMIDW